MTDRAAEVTRFLAATPWAEAVRTPLAGDASPRRYHRLRHPDLGTAVLMDAPQGVGAFMDTTQILRGVGYAAPAILLADPAAGLLVLEDLGDALFARVAAEDPAAEASLYEAAIDLLADLHRRPGLAKTRAPYDAAVWATEVRIATDWYLPPALAAEAETLVGLVGAACAAHAADIGVLTLRDYHAENLVWLPGRAGLSRVGLLDHQDALCGHPAYDVMSLLSDARRDVAPGLRQRMIARYLAASGADEAAFAAAYAVLSVQRNLKILGIFARLCRRDGKPGYLDLMPRVWGHIQADLAHPALAAVRDWVDRFLPPPDRAWRAQLCARPATTGAQA